MPIHRKFTASCDKCDAEFTGESDSSSHLKELMRKAGWKCGNTYVCPECRKCCPHCGNTKLNKTATMTKLDASQTLTVAESDGKPVEVVAVFDFLKP